MAFSTPYLIGESNCFGLRNFIANTAQNDITVQTICDNVQQALGRADEVHEGLEARAATGKS